MDKTYEILSPLKYRGQIKKDGTIALPAEIGDPLAKAGTLRDLSATPTRGKRRKNTQPPSSGERVVAAGGNPTSSPLPADPPVNPDEPTAIGSAAAEGSTKALSGAEGASAPTAGVVGAAATPAPKTAKPKGGRSKSTKKADA